MDETSVAIVGGGLGGLSLAAGIVRAAIDQKKPHISITIFEPKFIGPGLAYDTHAPDSFKLNHELDLMGSVNVRLRQLDPQDFFKWTQQHRVILQPLYPEYNLTNPKEYVPRSLYGRYLQVRYEELRFYAAEHNIYIHENHSHVLDIQKNKGSFVVATEEEKKEFDSVVLATGNYFEPLDTKLTISGKHFRPSEYRRYTSTDIPDNSIMLIIGTALFAYDAALYALESGKYSKVIMASRRGMLRKVRGLSTSYERIYLTINRLEQMAGGKTKPFRLQHILEAGKQELEHVYGHNIPWQDSLSVEEILDTFRRDLKEAKNSRSLPWRSMLASIPDVERHEIFARLHWNDKQLFLKKYTSLYNLFLAPMPSTNAEKLLKHIDEGRIEIVNGIQAITYQAQSKQFELQYAHHPNGAPMTFQKSSEVEPFVKIHPLRADVCIDARGMGRNIVQIPLYAKLLATGLAVQNQLGGIEVNLVSHEIVHKNGTPTAKFYAFGHMTCGETIISHNSLQISQLGIEIGEKIVASLTQVQSMFSLPNDSISPESFPSLSHQHRLYN